MALLTFFETHEYRPLLLVFLAVYGLSLVYSIAFMSVQWDEMPHLYGSLLLARGQTHEYMTAFGYYPPLYDAITTGYFHIFGISHAVGRLVAVTFSMLSVWLVFEFANRIYEPRSALIASILLGTMPGFFWVSRVAMLETMLVFFFTLTMLFFFTWITRYSRKALILTGLALGIGILAKYQVVVAVLVMLASILLLYRKRIRVHLKKLLLVLIITILVVAPWLMMIYQINGAAKFGELLYVMGEGSQDRPEYSNRFPQPIFYLVEMTWPFNDIPVHPISLPIFILSLCGLALCAYRRNSYDKLFLVWFMVVYVFFTLVPNRHWRYVIPLFPILAISATDFIMFLYGKISMWKRHPISFSKSCFKKLSATLFLVLVTVAIIYGSYNTYQMVERDQIHIPIEEAANFAASHTSENESMVVLAAFNFFNQDMLRFYLPANFKVDQVWQYPELAVDAFTPIFNIAEFISFCEQRSVKFVFFYEHGADIPFFNTTLTLEAISWELYESQRFSLNMNGTSFGTAPHRLFYTTFLSDPRHD